MFLPMFTLYITFSESFSGDTQHGDRTPATPGFDPFCRQRALCSQPPARLLRPTLLHLPPPGTGTTSSYGGIRRGQHPSDNDLLPRQTPSQPALASPPLLGGGKGSGRRGGRAAGRPVSSATTKDRASGHGPRYCRGSERDGQLQSFDV